MCGLCGELRFDGGPADSQAVRRMAATMRDRGPDAEGSWASGWIALGHRRLKILDLSDNAAQPMVDTELGISVAFNGCIYNFAELRTRLATSGYRFSSTGDTEVIIKAYHYWGDRFVDHLVGMFAIALADFRNRRVLLIRDRLGIKPLYLAETPGRLRFASTIKALLAAGDVDTSLDLTALHHQLAWRSTVPPPRTIFAGVRKLGPATMRVIEADGHCHEHIYWQPDFGHSTADAGVTEQEWAEFVASALRTAVRRRSVSDVPVGILLSGGLDSSLVAAMLAESGGGRLRTYSIGFRSTDAMSGDEFSWSDLVASIYGTDHQRIEASDQDLLESLPAAVAAMTEPMISRDCVAFYLLSREVAKSVRVVQTGQGADETFAGYFWHPLFVADTREAAADRASRMFTDDELTAALVPDARCDAAASREYIRSFMLDEHARSGMDAVLRLDTEVTMVEGPVKRIDSMTMAWGIEGRMPFTDHHLAELAARCPAGLKLARGGKGILKLIAAQFLPSDLVNRPKAYFPVPSLVRLDPGVRGWLRDSVTSSLAQTAALIRPGYLARVVDALPSPETDRALWQLGVLEHWLQSQLARIPELI